MRHYAGLDVSLEETAICVIDEAGRIVKEARVLSEPEALVGFFQALGHTVERIGLEACSLAAWLHEGLAAASLPAVCIETRQAKAAMGAMPNKTDRNDARAIAQIVRTGWFRAVHVKSPASRSWRALLTARRMVLNKLRDLENGVRALLREAGLKLGTPGRKQFAERVRELTAEEPVLAAPLLSIMATMAHELAQLTRRVLEVVRGEPVCRRLMSVPGVGPLTALAFRATIDQPGRFRRSRDVGAHLGLTPKRYQSGETDVQGGISRCGDELARTALHEAAHVLLVRSQKWSALRAWGMLDRAAIKGQASRHGPGSRCGRPEARGHSASHLDRRLGVPLGQGEPASGRARLGLSRATFEFPPRNGRSGVVPVGTTGEAIPLRASSRGACPEGRETDWDGLSFRPHDAAASAPTAERSA